MLDLYISVANCRQRSLEALAFKPLALKLPRTTDCFRFFAGSFFGGFFIGPPEFHFTEHSFALQLFFQRL